MSAEFDELDTPLPLSWFELDKLEKILIGDYAIHIVVGSAFILEQESGEKEVHFLSDVDPRPMSVPYSKIDCFMYEFVDNARKSKGELS